jgi:hypothetical protein
MVCYTDVIWKPDCCQIDNQICPDIGSWLYLTQPFLASYIISLLLWMCVVQWPSENQTSEYQNHSISRHICVWFSNSQLSCFSLKKTDWKLNFMLNVTILYTFKEMLFMTLLYIKWSRLFQTIRKLDRLSGFCMVMAAILLKPFPTKLNCFIQNNCFSNSFICIKWSRQVDNSKTGQLCSVFEWLNHLKTGPFDFQTEEHHLMFTVLLFET